MSIQITLSNPLTRLRRARERSLIASVNSIAGQLIEFRHEGVVRGGEVIATMLTAGVPVSLALKKVNEDLHLCIVIDRVEAKSHVLDDLSPNGLLSDVLAHPAVVQTLEAMRRAAGRSWLRKRFSIAAFMAMVLVVAAWPDRPALTGWAAATSTAKLEAPAQPEQASSTPQDMLDAAERQILARVVAESGIALNPSAKGKPFAVFSDPNCPACRELEKLLQSMSKDKFMPIVVPVAFKPGSMEAVAGVMCAKNLAAAWTAAAATAAPPAPTCAKGEAQVQNNNAAFVALRLNSTPTLVAPNGRVIAGTGTPEQVLRWLGENS
jgi:protein-disulfide isomerase